MLTLHLKVPTVLYRTSSYNTVGHCSVVYSDLAALLLPNRAKWAAESRVTIVPTAPSRLKNLFNVVICSAQLYTCAREDSDFGQQTPGLKPSHSSKILRLRLKVQELPPEY